MLVAVLGRHARLTLSASDIFVSIAGGIRIDEPAADLAVALAIASAERNEPLPPRVAVFGEISLTGELRSCSQSERRIAEAGRAGFDRVVVPRADAKRSGGALAAGAAHLREALASVRTESATTGGRVATDDWGV
jgi:DNA repair protein RadA/Sms